MGYLGLGFDSYTEYLASDWFIFVREKAWNRSNKCCAVCKKQWDLQPHHLSYTIIGMGVEWRYIRFLCSNHHHECHYVLYFFKIPLNSFDLTMRYIFVKYRYKLLHIISKLMGNTGCV